MTSRGTRRSSGSTSKRGLALTAITPGGQLGDMEEDLAEQWRATVGSQHASSISNNEVSKRQDAGIWSGSAGYGRVADHHGHSHGSSHADGPGQQQSTSPVLSLLLLATVACVTSGIGVTCIASESLCPLELDFLDNRTASINGTSTSNQQRGFGVGLTFTMIGAATLIPILLAFLCSRRLKSDPGATAARSDTLSAPLIGEEDSAAEDAAADPRHQGLLVLLFAAHFLSAWGDRMWQFVVPVLFIDLFIDTLWPTAAYALAVYLACVQLMPAVGAWIDRSHRLSVQRFALVVDNLSVLGTSIILCYIAVAIPNVGVEAPQWDTRFSLLFVGILILGITGELMNQAQTVSVERDWVVVIAEQSGNPLKTLNMLMRRIDLSCKLLAPAAVGFIISIVGNNAPKRRIFYGAAAVGLWNALSFPLELILTTMVFRGFPQLDCKMHTHEDDTKHSHANGHLPHSHIIHTHADGTTHLQDGPSDHTPDDSHLSSVARGDDLTLSMRSMGRVRYQDSRSTGPVSMSQKGGPIKSCISGFSAYVKHPIFVASLSYCALYCTVLDQGALMTAYLTWRGVDPAIVGASRGAGAIFGLLGTVLFPCLMRSSRDNLERSGFISIWVFWALLVPGLIAFFLAGVSVTSDYTVLASMVVARVGLWSFDLAITQILQEYVAEDVRGKINATQTATYQLFYVIVQAMGLVFNKPQQFEVLVTFSILVVLGACISYTCWYFGISTRYKSASDSESGPGLPSEALGASEDDDEYIRL